MILLRHNIRQARHTMKQRSRCMSLRFAWMLSGSWFSTCGNRLPVRDGNCDLKFRRNKIAHTSHARVDGSHELLHRACHPHNPPRGSKPLCQIAAANNLVLIASLLQTCMLLHYIIRLLVCLFVWFFF